MSQDPSKIPNIKFHENPCGRFHGVSNSGTDGQTDMTSSRFSQLLCERSL
jgi:hypothetical protein